MNIVALFSTFVLQHSYNYYMLPKVQRIHSIHLYRSVSSQLYTKAPLKQSHHLCQKHHRVSSNDLIKVTIVQFNNARKEPSNNMKCGFESSKYYLLSVKASIRLLANQVSKKYLKFSIEQSNA